MSKLLADFNYKYSMHFVLAICLSLSLVACGGGSSSNNSSNNNDNGNNQECSDGFGDASRCETRDSL